MWWLENSCVCYSNNMFQCVCGAADDMSENKTETEMRQLLSKAVVVCPSSEESDGSAFLNPLVRIGWYKNESDNTFNVHRVLAPTKQDYKYLKERCEKYDVKNRVRFHIED